VGEEVAAGVTAPGGLATERKRNDNESNIHVLSDLIQSHKLIMPTTLNPSDSLGNPLPNYMLPTNMKPIVTNSTNVNTATPSYKILTASQEMDNKIRDLE